jgi:hypothetical protein
VTCIDAYSGWGCRAEVEALQEQLQQEAAARNRMEEDMKRAFMRGVYNDCSTVLQHRHHVCGGIAPPYWQPVTSDRGGTLDVPVN